MKNVRLYIGDTLVQFTTQPDIFFNFQLDNLQDPTIVKNSFSKQITIEGTSSNNDLFGDLWQLDRAILNNGKADTGIYFNPSKKVPFQLFNNGEVYAEGYCKLDNIERQGQKIVYTVSLFGGLGEFFYNLMYSDTNDIGDNNKKTLGDLDYGYDLGFTINKDTVQEAWSGLTSNDDSKWKVINFAPCYNGIPDNFGADKAVINCRGNLPFEVSKVSGGTTYGGYGGYALASLPEEYTDIQTRDLRSYLQRPVIRMKSIIDACCDPANNGGYTVIKDNTFFTEDNPYYNDTWMTLPMLSEYDYIAGTEIADYSPTITVTRGTPTGNSSVVYTINGVDRQGLKKATISYKPTLNISGSTYENLYSAQIVNWSLPARWLDPFTYISKESGVMQILGAVGVQMVAYLNNKEVCSSDYFVFCSKVEGKYYVSGSKRGKKPIYIFGNWKKQAGTSNYVFYGEDNNAKMVDLVLDLNGRAYDTIKVVTETMCNDSSYGIRLFSATKYSVSGSKSDDCKYTSILQNHFDDPQFAFIGAEESKYASLSNRNFSQKMLLDTEGSPADYLLSFCKMFGLYFIKEPDERVIRILTRTRFYHRTDRNLKDINSLIDRSQPINIVPLTMTNKWYDWKQEMVESMYAESYNKTTSMDYGMKRVNTGYEFNADVKNLYENSQFKGAVECLEKSRMYSYAPSGETDTMQWMVDGFDLTLYNANNVEDTISIKVPQLRGLQPINKANLKFYDLFPKAQFRDADNGNVDGRNVLLFYLGQVSGTSQYNSGVNLHYWLTDDLNMMLSLNDEEPCWLYTTVSADTANQVIALPVDSLPRFGRYMGDENEIIQWSLDFGEPRELFVPTYQTREQSTIYYNYWKNYIEDIYDIDNRVVEAYVFLNNGEFKPNENLLRYFYFFDNALWRINKITDWNLVKEGTTKVEFVKVRDKANYNNHSFVGDNLITISADTATLPQTGGTVTFTVTCSDPNMEWEGYDSWFQATGSVPFGTGSGTFSVEFPPLTQKDTTWNLTLYVDEYNLVSNPASILQSGITLNMVGPAGNVPATGGTIAYTVNSTYDWELVRISSSQDGPMPVMSPTSGHSGATNVTITYGDIDLSLTDIKYYIDIKDVYDNTYRKTETRDGINEYMFPDSGGSVTMKALKPYFIIETASWLSHTDNENNVVFTATANSDPNNERSTTVYYVDTTGFHQITFRQRKYEILEASPKNITFKYYETSAKTTTITSNTDWTITKEN